MPAVRVASDEPQRPLLPHPGDQQRHPADGRRVEPVQPIEHDRDRRLDVLNPPPVRRPPLLIAGTGERRTLKLVAQYADGWHATFPDRPEDLGPEAADRWEAMSVAARRAVLDTLGIAVVLLPREKHGPGFEPETVRIEWKSDGDR